MSARSQGPIHPSASPVHMRQSTYPPRHVGPTPSLPVSHWPARHAGSNRRPRPASGPINPRASREFTARCHRRIWWSLPPRPVTDRWAWGFMWAPRVSGWVVGGGSVEVGPCVRTAVQRSPSAQLRYYSSGERVCPLMSHYLQFCHERDLLVPLELFFHSSYFCVLNPVICGILVCSL